MPEINIFFRDIFGGAYRITQGFNDNFILNGKPAYPDKHGAVDFGCSQGTQLYAPVGGLVTWHENPGGYGHYMMITKFIGSTKYEFIFAHLYDRQFENTRVIKKGDKLALSGGAKGLVSSGKSTAAHLHFELRVNGKKVDPETFDFSIFNIDLMEDYTKNRLYMQMLKEVPKAFYEALFSDYSKDTTELCATVLGLFRYNNLPDGKMLNMQPH